MNDHVEPTAIADENVPERRPGRDATLAAGDVLNGIYKVERFIARGGMGEVFEGVNVETDERVAIKAIRSHLASDPKAIALFRKEARVLTHIAHPAIVQYRVFARDPVLDLHYIVTDFINGEPITAYLDGERPGIGEVVTLARRLAAGLEAAHEHGAIHRDMSPDNVLLPDGKIERAKIIDFGIAKSLDLTVETVVGDGFAGKLGYVAPEQFGDFGRQVGPWTDVYSTALVLLAFMRGKAPAMGTTLSEAVERRRVGPDLSDLPPALAPLIEHMTVPDPAGRVRSMREVLHALDEVRLPEDVPVLIVVPTHEAEPPASSIAEGGANDPKPKAPPPSEPAAVTTFAPAVRPAEAPAPEPEPERRRPVDQIAPALLAREKAVRKKSRRRRWPYAAIPVAGAAAGVLAWYHAPQAEAPAPAPAAHLAAPPVALPQLSATDRASKLDALLGDMPCSWVQAHPTTEGGPTRLSGGSGDVGVLAGRLKSDGQSLGATDATDVLSADPAQCRAIDALRPYHVPIADQGFATLSLAAADTGAGEAEPACPGGGMAEVMAAGYDPQRGFALIALQPDGRLLQVAGSRNEFKTLAEGAADRFNIGADGAYHATVCYAHGGTGAIFLIDSGSAIDLGLRTGEAVPVPADFARRVADLAGRQKIRVFAAWAHIGGIDHGALPAPSAAVASSTPSAVVPKPAVNPATVKIQAGFGPMGEGTRAQAAVDTASANRSELERIKALAKPEDGGSTAVCRAFDGGWKDVGRLGRDACLAQAIKGHCRVNFATYKNHAFRRQNGHIQEQRGGRWRDVAEDSGC